MIPGKIPGEGKGYQLQYSDLENSMDCIVHGVTKRWTRLSNFHFIPLPRMSLIRAKHMKIGPRVIADTSVLTTVGPGTQNRIPLLYWELEE